jgi:hypothetical protein
MNMTFTIAMLICMFLLMFTIPFLVFMGLGSALGAQPDEIRVLISYFLFAGIVVFLASLGVFVLMQKEDCGKVQSIQKAANNSGLALLIQVVTLVLVWLVAPLRGVVTNLLPPDIDPNISASLGYGYFGAFAGAISTLVGASFSGMCDDVVTPMTMPSLSQLQAQAKAATDNVSKTANKTASSIS